MQLQLNKPYILFCALLGTSSLAFIGWAVTNQVYGQWSLGLPITGGFNWPIVIGIDLICLMGVLALYWKIYADANTVIDAKGLSRPTLRGMKHIAWSEVVAIKTFNGIGFHVHGSSAKIVISPHAYRDPNQVIEALYQHNAKDRA